MKKYSKYKKTDIDWIGEIPEGWEVKRLGYVFYEKSEKVSDKDYAPLSVTKRGVVPQLDNAAKTKNHSDRKLVNKNDFVINSRSDRRGSSGVSKLDGSVSVAYTVLKSNHTVDMDYYHYLFRSLSFTDEFYRFGKGIVADLWSTRFSEMKNIYIPIPRFEQQREISAFLTTKTHTIDKLIASNEKQIKLLEEKRKATINQAVTKGLDPDIKMKDSGVEWIGEIPEHWEVKKLKYSVQLLSEKGNEFKKIALENIQSKTGKYIETDTIFQGDGVEFNKGDILFGKLRPYLAKVWEAEFQGSAVGDFFVMRPNKSNNPTYRKYQILSDLIIDVLNGSTYGAKMPRVSWDFMGELLLPEPPIDQQEEIANYLDGISQETQDLIIKVRKQNKLLKEYRQSLISHVVTGKVDVRDEVKMLEGQNG